MSTVVQNELCISYEIIGEGEPVLFLPGTATDSSVWLAGVESYLSGYRSVLVDPRDTPKSDLSTAPYTPADLARDAEAILDAADIDRAHVVGYSLGAASAQELAILRPDRVASLTLVCSWGRTDGYLRNVFSWLKDGLDAAGSAWAHRALIWLTLSPSIQEGPAYEGALSILDAWGQEPVALRRQLECDAVHDSLDRLGSVKARTLIIGGGLDIFVPARYSRELAKVIPGATLEILESGAHSIPIENQADLYGLLRSHLLPE